MVCQILFKNEAEVYRRMVDRAGIDVPQLIALNDIPSSRVSANSYLRSDIDDVPGILMQYVPRIPLQQLEHYV